MKSLFTLLLVTVFSFIYLQSKAQQDKPVHPSLIGQGVFLGITPPLRDIPPLTQEEVDKLGKSREKENELNEKLEHRSYPFAASALPKGPDAVWQKSMGTKSALSNSPIQNFAGQSSSSYPPDCNGAVGPSHYMQTVNVTYAIYDKTGTKLVGPNAMNTLFTGQTGATCNDGDPIVLYDEQANRWLAVEFSLCGSNDYMLIAVSTTSDPTGTWYKYSFDVADVPDYEKFGIWQDGYYMGVNNSSGKDIYVFERSKMLQGLTANFVGFDNPYRPTSVDGFMCVPPVDNDGTFAPTGAPGTFIAFNDDAIGGGADQLWIYELHADWTTLTNSTFNRVQQIAVSSFDSDFGTDWYNIAQPGTSMQLDAIPMVVMNVPQYRNFGTYQTLVCCQTVDVNATDHGGIRWYELRRGTQSSGGWRIRQQGTYAPDANHRWMGSIMLNGSGKIGLGYSVSGTISGALVYPSIRYTGQSASAYADSTGVMDIPEESIQVGGFSQTSYERWGDYSLLSVDPTDDQTFWYTTEYMTSNSAHGTKIASFKFGNSPIVTTTAATAVTATTATLNGTVNPNGIATTYYFQYGLTTAYGSTTTSASAGSGSAAVSESAAIASLTAGKTYHFRIVATNSDGTSYGSDLTLTTTGAAIVTTTAASAIAQYTATSGGVVTSDGGFGVTARGVCWAITADPVVTGSHTTDGSGTGTFTSSITGLSANTLYHVRAYATNVNGTYYGSDLTFTTTCGVISTFPWNEGFENAGIIPNCWTQEMVSSSGINWTFITGSGNSNPAAAHGGTYNATLKDVSSGDNKTRLITPSINLSSLSSPTLTFYHTQAVWSGDQDVLTVYYRTSSTGTWTLLATYSASLTAWTLETISLPNATSDYYIDFEGNAKYGYGICIDDVAIAGTAPTLPTVTTTTPSLITTTTASSGGNVTSIGGSAVTAKGVCWATTASPVATGSHTTDGTGLGAFTSSITGLTANTLYHVRAYATNTAGTAYGSDLTFTTCSAMSPVSVTIAASANPVCSGTSVTFTATPTNGGTPTYQWYKNAAAVATGATYTYTPANNDVVYVVMTSSLSCTTGSPATSTSITMTVNPMVAASVTMAASANPVCAGTTVTFTPTPTNGGTPSYQWYKNSSLVGTGSTYAYRPVDGDQVYVIMTSSLTCKTGSPATSNIVTMTVNPAMPASVLVTPSANPICASTTVTFTPTPTNGGSPFYQWYKNSTLVGTASTYSYVPVNGDQVYVVMTSSLTCATGSPATSTAITMAVDPILPVSVSISPSANPVCAGVPVTFTTTPTNGGTTPIYQWYVNLNPVGTGLSTYSYTPVSGDQVYVMMTSSLNCKSGSPATSSYVTMTVDPVLPASVSIAPSANPVCAGTSVTFTATPTNGGTPTYQWYKNTIAAGTGATYSYTPVDGDIVYVVMTSSLNCKSGSPATSGSVTMTVTPVLPVSVSIVPSANPVCAGTSVTFTATPTNGGTPTYQWYKNTVAVGTGATYSYTPVDGDVVYVTMTSSLTCKSGSPATSGSVSMTVTPVLPVSVSISPSANPVCAGVPVTFTTTPTNGGTTPTYQWYVNLNPVGTGLSTYSYTPVSGDQVYVMMTSSLSCKSGSPATSSFVTMTVDPVLPASVSIAPSANPVCAGTSVTFTATPTNGGTPTYQWYKNTVAAGTGATYSYIPVNGDVVYVTMTSSLSCKSGSPATSGSVTMTVNPVLPVSVAIAPSANPVCAGTSVTFTATPTNGGTPAYQWYRNTLAVGTGATYTYSPSDGDVVYVTMTSSLTCKSGSPATSGTVTMTVNPVLPVSVAIAPSANPVCAGTSVTFTATPTNGGTPAYQWYKNTLAVGTGAAYSYIPVDGDVVYVSMTSNLTCKSGSPATSGSVTMTVNPLLPVSVSIASSANPVCAGTSVTFTATPTNGGTPAYQWYKNTLAVGTGATYSYAPADGDIVYVTMTSNLTCKSGSPATSGAVTMTVNPLLPVSVSVTPSANPVLAGTDVTFTATPTNGGTGPIYQWNVNGSSVGTNNPVYSYIPMNDDVVACTLISDGNCAIGNPVSGSVTMVVNPLLLSVTPANQDVPNVSGLVSFNVTSNTSWSVESDQAWCTVSYTGHTGNGSFTAFYESNTLGSPRVAHLTATVTGLAPIMVTVTQDAAADKVLNLTIFLEGLFNGTSMNKAQNAAGDQFPGTVADQITVELHNSTAPYALAGGPFTVNVNTDGTASATVPAVLGSNYYIVVKHHNSLETWNGIPQSFSGSVINYDFSTASTQAYGHNLKLISGKYVLYTGDINQDGLIDSGDMVQLNNDAMNFVTGYNPTDLNGDGIVDAGDIILLDNNAAIFIVKVAP
jgi:hypothetical protein